MVFLQIILLEEEEVANEALIKGVLIGKEARFVHIMDSQITLLMNVTKNIDILLDTSFTGLKDQMLTMLML